MTLRLVRDRLYIDVALSPKNQQKQSIYKGKKAEAIVPAWLFETCHPAGYELTPPECSSIPKSWNRLQ